MDDNIVETQETRSILRRMAGSLRRKRAVASRAVALNETRSKPLATELEVADNPYTRRKGLLGRDGLASGGGLWIYPCESVHTFAMRFPIDLVYLDRDCVVKKLRSNVRPGRMSVCFMARSVIELPAGTIEATGTEIGDRIAIQQMG